MRLTIQCLAHIAAILGSHRLYCEVSDLLPSRTQISHDVTFEETQEKTQERSEMGWAPLFSFEPDATLSFSFTFKKGICLDQITAL